MRGNISKKSGFLYKQLKTAFPPRKSYCLDQINPVCFSLIQRLEGDLLLCQRKWRCQLIDNVNFPLTKTYYSCLPKEDRGIWYLLSQKKRGRQDYFVKILLTGTFYKDRKNIGGAHIGRNSKEYRPIAVTHFLNIQTLPRESRISFLFFAENDSCSIYGWHYWKFGIARS